jgi:hypothetical protein
VRLPNRTRHEHRNRTPSFALRRNRRARSNIPQTAIKEVRMNTIYAFGLATVIVFSQSLHAQGCSGGSDGGMDATGNQCNAPGSFMTYTTETITVRPVELRGADLPGRARPLAVRPSKSSLPQFRSTRLAMPVSRFAALPATESPSPKAAMTAATLEATCSGGSDGGMDASGNQCSAPPVTAGNALATHTRTP